ncbi:DUF169 domain-containing protein [Desulfatiglans anilini]|uniref:DUF169 domain-containing protein n=1 Tax=Desulfatiglans anilini TaxID=90728 RepID=UPI0003F576EF|nr:DUF169 domain-containing protein [Desulfatiglans anilini]
MIDTTMLLNDVEFARQMLEKETLSHSDIVFTLRNLLKFKYYPVAVKFFFSEEELEDYKQQADYKEALHPFTLCHYVAASRQGGEITLSTKEKTGCSNAKYVLGWKELDESEIKGHLKYTQNLEQAERFVKTKKRLPPGLLAFATAPLHKSPFVPDVIHGMSDVLQSYHLGNDWCAAFDTHPFRMTMSMNSSVCHGIVRCYVTQEPNITPMCSSSYTSGKTEQGEINWIWPGSHLERTVRWTLQRTLRDGGASFPRTGETYPGFNICKLCPLIAWKKPKKQA